MSHDSRLLYKNQYSTLYTQIFPDILSLKSPLQNENRDISYVVTNILKVETINYIIEEI